MSSELLESIPNPVVKTSENNYTTWALYGVGALVAAYVLYQLYNRFVAQSKLPQDMAIQPMMQGGLMQPGFDPRGAPSGAPPQRMAHPVSGYDQVDISSVENQNLPLQMMYPTDQASGDFPPSMLEQTRSVGSKSSKK